MSVDRLFLCVFGLGLFSGIMGIVVDYVLLRRTYLPNRSKRELQMARWRGVGSSVGIAAGMWCVASFLAHPHQMVYIRLMPIPAAIAGILSAMNMHLMSEARKARRERSDRMRQ